MRDIYTKQTKYTITCSMLNVSSNSHTQNMYTHIWYDYVYDSIHGVVPAQPNIASTFDPLQMRRLSRNILATTFVCSINMSSVCVCVCRRAGVFKCVLCGWFPQFPYTNTSPLRTILTRLMFSKIDGPLHKIVRVVRAEHTQFIAP